MKWQPIETAPKDGTDIILLWHTQRGGPKPIVGHWAGDLAKYWYCYSVHNPTKVTRWMPLPELPKL